MILTIRHERVAAALVACPRKATDATTQEVVGITEISPKLHAGHAVSVCSSSVWAGGCAWARQPWRCRRGVPPCPQFGETPIFSLKGSILSPETGSEDVSSKEENFNTATSIIQVKYKAEFGY